MDNQISIKKYDIFRKTSFVDSNKTRTKILGTNLLPKPRKNCALNLRGIY